MTQPQQPTTVLIPDYVKYVEVSWSAMDVTLLMSKAGFNTGPGQPIVDGGKMPIGAISISPVMAKGLAKDLAAAIEAYERQFGPIPAPPENANVVALRPVDGETRHCWGCQSPLGSLHTSSSCPAKDYTGADGERVVLEQCGSVECEHCGAAWPGPHREACRLYKPPEAVPPGKPCPSCGVAVGEVHHRQCPRHMLVADKSDPLSGLKPSRHR